MSILGSAANLMGDVGFGVIKNAGRVVMGGGEAILGVVTDNDELVESGVKRVAQGTVGAGIAVAKKALFDDDSDDGEGADFDMDGFD